MASGIIEYLAEGIAVGMLRGDAGLVEYEDAVVQDKFVANCIYGGWNAARAQQTPALLRTLRSAP
ncbi:MAG: hypothetical protein ABI831_18085, partial [Betaproteobacteria bacterium]